MTAEIYDAIYAFKDYAAEAKRLTDLVDQYKTSEGNNLLDVACGTGAHLPYLRDRFDVMGIDLSEEQLVAARKRLPDVEFVHGDMRDFNLGRQFDVVTCLFSSIGYVHAPKDLQAAIGTMAKHLKPGGVLLVEPWLDKEHYDPNHDSPPDEGTLPDGTKVVRTAKHSVEGNLSVMMMHHELNGPSGHSEFDEEHRLAMHGAEDFKTAFEAAGLSFEFNETGLGSKHGKSRGLYVGVKE